jgi:glycosyltransferase involved in cell wall biosynthesis
MQFPDKDRKFCRKPLLPLEWPPIVFTAAVSLPLTRWSGRRPSPLSRPPMSRCVSIFVPALNEAQKIRTTVSDILALANEFLDRFEILIFDDASTDDTSKIADELAAAHDCIKVVHNSTRGGLATNFHRAIAMARHQYITIVPGDGAFRTDGLAVLFGAVDRADMVISYRTNMWETRSWVRYVISRSLTHVVNLLCGLKLNDVHSLGVFPVAELRNLKLISTNAGFFVEILVKLQRLPLTCLVVPMTLTPEQHVLGRSLLEINRGADMFRVLFHLFFSRISKKGHEA